MTAITPASAHAYQATCLTRHMPAVPRKNFRLPMLKARYPHLPNARSTTRERGNDFKGWAIYTDGCTRVVDGETLAGWGVIARSHHGRIDIMLGPVITTEAPLAFSGARTHSNNTVEMTAMIEALSFLWPRGPVARDMDSCIYYDSKHAAGVCLGTIQAQAHMFNWRLHVSGRRYAPNTGYGLSCNTCTETLGTWVLNVLIMPLRLVHLASFPVTILPLAGFVITLTHLPVLVTVTISARSWKNCMALELKQHRYLRTRVSAVFLIGFFVTLTHAFASLVFLLSAFFPRVHFVLQEKQWKAQLRLSLPR